MYGEKHDNSGWGTNISDHGFPENFAHPLLRCQLPGGGGGVDSHRVGGKEKGGLWHRKKNHGVGLCSAGGNCSGKEIEIFDGVASPLSGNISEGQISPEGLGVWLRKALAGRPPLPKAWVPIPL